MISTGNVTHAHAQDIVVKDKLLLFIPNTSARYTRSLHAPRNSLCFRYVCSSRTVFAPTSSSSVVTAIVSISLHRTGHALSSPSGILS